MNPVLLNSPHLKVIEDKIRKEHQSGKLKDSKIKKFMKDYYDGNPMNPCPKGCSSNCLLDCYIDIHQSLIDDDGNVNEFKTPYKRNKKLHCCGKEAMELPNKHMYCEVCGNEY